MFHWPKPKAARAEDMLIECVIFDDKDRPVRHSQTALTRYLWPIPAKDKPIRADRPGAI